MHCLWLEVVPLIHFHVMLRPWRVLVGRLARVQPPVGVGIGQNDIFLSSADKLLWLYSASQRR